MTTTARGRALAKQDKQIADNVTKIEAQKQRPNALQVMATRLNISPSSLQKTLKSTVFNKANDDEFAALVIVANEYGLNPLTKEIYAFPAKGGGIVPLVSIDGWIRIMNEHPQMDGYEHEDIFLDGAFVAVETSIYRKDRTRPIKVTEYLDECKRPTEPWKLMPHRMLRHKSLIQCARIAFGFSGINDEEDVVYMGGDLEPMQQARIPTNKELRKEAKEEGADEETGEIVDQEPADERTEQEVAEELDAQQSAQERGISDEPETQAEQSTFDKLITQIVAVTSKDDLKKADTDFQKVSASLSDDEYQAVDDKLNAARKRLDA